MRRLLLLAALGGCFGTLDANLHPTVIPKLSVLADDKRAQQLDAAHARPDPEQRKRDLSPRSRKLELAAAITAAFIGDAYSHSHSVTLGIASDFDETGTMPGAKKAHAPEAARIVPDPSLSELVPWVHLALPTSKDEPAPTDDAPTPAPPVTDESHPAEQAPAN